MIRVVRNVDDGFERVEEVEAMSFEDARAVVGGTVQAVQLAPDRYVLVNEEGRLRGLPFNLWASLAAELDLLGNAIFLDGEYHIRMVLGGTE